MNNPITFEPIAMERVWGGFRLAQYGKKLPPGAPIGEVWESSIARTPKAS